MSSIEQILQDNTYPGRGIMIGKSDNKAVITYFIMGRSVNSRNRIFNEKDKGIETKAFDESKLSDPSLIIYNPVKVAKDGTIIVTNGDQTDTIYDFLNNEDTFENALRTRLFEPDAPNYTPRISGVVNISNGELKYKLSILKSLNNDGETIQRFFYEYENTPNNTAHFIHTYKQDGNPIPSFSSDPTLINISGDIDTFTNNIWSALNEDNKVSLYTRFVDLTTLETETRIINKNN